MEIEGLALPQIICSMTHVKLYKLFVAESVIPEKFDHHQGVMQRIITQQYKSLQQDINLDYT